MVITKENLIQTIAKQLNIRPSIIKSVVGAMENEIIANLALASPGEDVTVKILNGLSIRCRYEDEQELNKGFFKNCRLSPCLRTKTETTRTFLKKVNQAAVHTVLDVPQSLERRNSDDSNIKPYEHSRENQGYFEKNVS